MVEKTTGMKLYYVNILSALDALLGTLLSMSPSSKVVDNIQCTEDVAPEEVHILSFFL